MACGITILHPTCTNVDLNIDYTLDIVSVHGLNGDPLRTWTHPSTKHMWQRDFLPLDLPNARIMTFGYDAQAAFGNSTSGIVEHARMLLNDLADVREGAWGTDYGAKRSLIFVCHSLGGLVVKRALLLAQQEAIYSNIHQSVLGVIFFGTPHQGSYHANLASFFVKIPAALGVKPNASLMEAIRRGSPALVDLSQAFKRHHEANPYPVVSFYEMKTMRVIGSLVVDKSSALLTPPGEIPTYEIQIPVPSVHQEMCRFATTKDRTYRAVVRHIRRMIDDSTNPDTKNEYFLVGNTVDTYFTGRHAIRDKLRERLIFNRSRTHQQRFVLFGMGGSGKTQLCLKFASDFRNRFWGVFFVDASSIDSAERAFQQIARALGTNASMQAVFEVLSIHDSWLLIIDNADDPNLDISRFFPPGINGTIIVTTRNPDLQKFGTAGCYRVDEMDKEDAIILLLKAAACDNLNDESRRQTAERIVLQLGRLALAIVQAGAVVRQKLCNLENFCDMYSARSRMLLELGRPTSSIDYQHSVFTTWEISYEAIEKIDTNYARFALCLLGIFSFMHFDDIGEDIFRRAQNSSTMKMPQANRQPLNYKNIISELFSSGWDDILWAKAVALLASYSLIHITTADRISVHPLVHAWSRDRLPEDDRRAVREIALLILTRSATIEKNSQHYLLTRSLVLHVDACLSLETNDFCTGISSQQERLEALLNFTELYQSCDRYDRSLELSWLYLESLRSPMLDASYQTREIFRIKTIIGVTLSLAGRYSESFELYQELLPEMWAAQFTTQALNIMSNQAGNLLALGEYDSAIGICTQVIQKAGTSPHEKSSSIYARQILGSCLVGLDKLKKALVCLEDAIKEAKEEFGDRTMHIVYSKMYLAECYVAMGRYKKAQALQVECLAHTRHLTGEASPHMAVNLESFVYCRRHPTRSSLAQGEETLALHRKLFGDTNPKTLRCITQLGLDYFLMGFYTKALPLQEEALKLKEASMGTDHVVTIKARKRVQRTRMCMAARKVIHFWYPKRKKKIGNEM